MITENYATYQKKITLIAASVKRMSGTSFTVEELCQDGWCGLLDAASRYDASSGVTLWAYAEYRVRGAMQDALRKAGFFLQRKDRRAGKRIQPLYLDAPIGRNKESGGIYDDRWYDTIFDKIATIGDIIADPSAIRAMRRSNTALALRRAMAQLPQPYQEVLHAYYGEEKDLKTIGRQLGLTESRICQLHKEALRHLRDRLGDELCV